MFSKGMMSQFCEQKRAIRAVQNIYEEMTTQQAFSFGNSLLPLSQSDHIAFFFNHCFSKGAVTLATSEK